MGMHSNACPMCITHTHAPDYTYTHAHRNDLYDSVQRQMSCVCNFSF